MSDMHSNKVYVYKCSLIRTMTFTVDCVSTSSGTAWTFFRYRLPGMCLVSHHSVSVQALSYCNCIVFLH